MDNSKRFLTSMLNEMMFFVNKLKMKRNKCIKLARADSFFIYKSYYLSSCSKHHISSPKLGLKDINFIDMLNGLMK